MRQAGRYMEEYRQVRAKYSLKEICREPELAAKVTLDPLKKLEVDAAILFSDILLIIEPFGFKLDYVKGEGPDIANPIQNSKDVRRLPAVDVRSSLSAAGAALRIIKKELKPGISLIGFAGAPFTLASYLIEGGPSRDYLKTKAFLHQQPEAWKLLMTRLASATQDYLAFQIEAGADAVQIFDSWVGCLSPDDYEKSVLPYVQSMIRSLQQTKAPVIYFGTGTAGLLPLIRRAGADVISVDWRIPLGAAWDAIGPHTAIQGNLDPAALFAPRDVLRGHVLKILQEAAGRPGHIFNLGHGILPETPVDNVRYVADLVHGKE